MKARQIITKKKGIGKFDIWFPDQPKLETLSIDIEPLIKAFKLTGSYVLIHWQARPKYERRWGIYDADTDMYFSREFDQLFIADKVALWAIEIPENSNPTPPTAMLYLPDSRLRENGEEIVIESVLKQGGLSD